MIMLQRKIKCKFVGSDEFLPENFPKDKFVPVIGYEIRKRILNRKDKAVTVEDVYYQVVDNRGKLITIASFNCITMIDDFDSKTIMSIAQSIGSVASMVLSSSSEGTIHVVTTTK